MLDGTALYLPQCEVLLLPSHFHYGVFVPSTLKSALERSHQQPRLTFPRETPHYSNRSHRRLLSTGPRLPNPGKAINTLELAHTFFLCHRYTPQLAVSLIPVLVDLPTPFRTKCLSLHSRRTTRASLGFLDARTFETLNLLANLAREPSGMFPAERL